MDPNPLMQSEEHTSCGRYFRPTYSKQDSMRIQNFKGRDGIVLRTIPVLLKLGLHRGTAIHLYRGHERAIRVSQFADLLFLPTCPVS